MTAKSLEMFRKALPIMDAAFEEIDDNFTSQSFCALLREKGIDERIISNNMHLAYLAKKAYKPNSAYPKSYRKNNGKKSIDLPQSNNSPQLFNLSNEGIGVNLKSFTDKQLANELETRGYTVLISEVNYRKPNFELWPTPNQPF